MTFAETAALKAFWVIPLAICFLWWGVGRRRQRLLKFFGQNGQAAWISGGRTLVKGCLFVLALAFLVLGLAGPRWNFEWREIKRGGVDIMVVLDVSRSMLAQDVSPNRLERAKREIVDLLGRAQGDRLGLVAFAGTAFVQCPLTTDYGALRLFLDHIDTELIPTQGTDIGFALEVAAEGLAQGGTEESTGQAILLMTDGEDLEGVGLEQAKALAEKGIKIFTMSIGSSDGGPIPIPGGGFKKDAAGNMVITRPDIAALKTIALTGGGTYVSSVPTDADLRYLYDQGIKATLAEREFETTRKRLWYERFQWFLLAAFGLLVVEFLIRDAKPTRVSGLTVLLASVLFMFGAEGAWAASPGLTGQQQFEQGRYDKASDHFLEAEIEDPQSAQHTYNKGVADYKAGGFKAAADAFEQAAKKAQGPLHEQSLFNLGNARAMAGDLQEAVQAYEETLKLKPDHKQASENLRYVKQLIEQQPPPEPGDQGESDKDQQQQEEQQQQDQQQDQQQEEQKQDQQSEGQASEQKAQDQNQDQGNEQNQNNEQDERAAEQQGTENEQDDARSRQHEDDQEGQAGQSEESEQQPAPEEMTEAQAEQVLRSIQNYSQRYLYRPPQKRGAPRPKKDW